MCVFVCVMFLGLDELRDLGGYDNIFGIITAIPVDAFASLTRLTTL